MLSPLGLYPSRVSFRQPDAAIIVRPDLMALITRFQPVIPPEKYYFSEVETLSAFEIRILGALLLSRTRDSGAFEIYPADLEYRTADVSLDLSRPAVLSSLLAKLKDQLGRRAVNGVIGHRVQMADPMRSISMQR